MSLNLLANAIKAPGEKWGCCVIIYDPDNSNRILVCKRAPGDRTEPNTWGFPGGKVDDGESPYDAAFREVEEEVDIYLENITYVGCFKEGEWTDFVFLAKMPKFAKVKLKEDECSDHGWATIDELESGWIFAIKATIFSFTLKAIEFYKPWKEIYLYRELEKSRREIMNQLP